MCTSIRLISKKDDTVVYARTNEFSTDMQSAVIVVPRHFARTGTTPVSGQEGAKWESKYASVGANGLHEPFIADGLNEKGLAIGLLYFPTFADYMTYSPSTDHDITIAPWELGSWLLDQFQNVKEVKENIGKVVVANVIFPQWKFVPPLHCVVHDAEGNCIVIEYVNGKLNVHDNQLGVMTNSPPFDWHTTNLRNYLNLSVNNLPALTLNGSSQPVTLEPIGQGTGMLGLPGDLMPPSRFVRAVAYTQSILPELIQSGHDTVLQAFHILNSFDIPKGLAREKTADGQIVADYTLWTSANDLKAKKFYFRTYENSQIRVVDLMKMDLTADSIATISMYDEKEVIRSMT